MSQLRLVTSDPDIYVEIKPPGMSWPTTGKPVCSICGDIRSTFPDLDHTELLPLNEVVIYAGWHLLKAHRKGEWSW